MFLQKWISNIQKFASLLFRIFLPLRNKLIVDRYFFHTKLNFDDRSDVLVSLVRKRSCLLFWASSLFCQKTLQIFFSWKFQFQSLNLFLISIVENVLTKGRYKCMCFDARKRFTKSLFSFQWIGMRRKKEKTQRQSLITFLFNANYVGQKSNRFRNNNKSSYTPCTEGSRPTFPILSSFLKMCLFFSSRQTREPRPPGTTKYNRFSALTLPVGEFPKTTLNFSVFKIQKTSLNFQKRG